MHNRNHDLWSPSFTEFRRRWREQIGAVLSHSERNTLPFALPSRDQLAWWAGADRPRTGPRVRSFSALFQGSIGKRRRLLKIRDVSLFVEVIGHGYPLLRMHGGPQRDHFTLLP